MMNGSSASHITCCLVIIIDKFITQVKTFTHKHTQLIIHNSRVNS